MNGKLLEIMLKQKRGCSKVVEIDNLWYWYVVKISIFDLTYVSCKKPYPKKVGAKIGLGKFYSRMGSI